MRQNPTLFSLLREESRREENRTRGSVCTGLTLSFSWGLAYLSGSWPPGGTARLLGLWGQELQDERERQPWKAEQIPRHQGVSEGIQSGKPLLPSCHPSSKTQAMCHGMGKIFSTCKALMSKINTYCNKSIRKKTTPWRGGGGGECVCKRLEKAFYKRQKQNIKRLLNINY